MPTRRDIYLVFESGQETIAVNIHGTTTELEQASVSSSSQCGVIGKYCEIRYAILWHRGFVILINGTIIDLP